MDPKTKPIIKNPERSPVPAEEFDKNAIGAKAILSPLDPFTIEGKEYKFARLGLDHAMSTLRIFASSSAGVLKTLQGEQPNGTVIAFAVMGALPYAEKNVKELLSSMIKTKSSDGMNWVNVSIADISNPDIFPLGEFPNLFERLASHPDLDALIKNTSGLMKTPVWLEMQNRFSPPATKEDGSSPAQPS